MGVFKYHNMKSIYTSISVLLYLFFMDSLAYGQSFQRDSIQLVLEEAYYRDQAPRQTIDSLMRSSTLDGNKYLLAIEQQEQADSVNLAVVLPIIDLIYESQIYDLDSMSYKACWTVIQHAPDAIMHKYEDFVKQIAIRKLLSMHSYMAYIDRCKIRQSKAQIYGWQFKRMSNGIIVQYPMLTGVESRWKELGLEYKESLLIPEEYDPKYMSKTGIDNTQFAILGAITCNIPNQTVDDLSISINGVEVIKENHHAFFEVIISKQDLPAIIKFSTSDDFEEYTIKLNDEMDYVFLSCLVDENMIEIKEE